MLAPCQRPSARRALSSRDAASPGKRLFAQSLGGRIRELRAQAEITQERLAWACGLDKGYLSQVESGKRLPSLPVLTELAVELGVEAIDLLGFDMESPRAVLLDAARRKSLEEVRRALRRLGIEI